MHIAKTSPFLFLLLAACASTDASELTSASDPLRITPTTGDAVGGLRVSLPAAACAPGGTCASPLGVLPIVRVDGKVVSLGATTFVASGDHVVTVQNPLTFVSDAITTRKAVNVGVGTTVEVNLAVLDRTCKVGTGRPAHVDLGDEVTGPFVGCTMITAIGDTATDGNLENTGMAAATMTLYPDYGCKTGGVEVTASTDCNAITGSYVSAGAGLCDSLYTSTSTGSAPAQAICRAAKDAAANATVLFSSYYDLASSLNPATTCGTTALHNDFYLRQRNTLTRWSKYQVHPSCDDLKNASVGHIAVVPGTITLSNGAGTRTLAAGDVTTLDLDFAYRDRYVSTRHVSFLSDRALPDAAPTLVQCGTSSFRLTRATAGDAAFTYDGNACSPFITLGGEKREFNYEEPGPGQVQRIEMDDVPVTVGGVVTPVRGTYEVYKGANLVAGPFPTNTGVDVWPGSYTVVLKWTAAGTPLTRGFVADLPALPPTP